MGECWEEDNSSGQRKDSLEILNNSIHIRPGTEWHIIIIKHFITFNTEFLRCILNRPKQYLLIIMIMTVQFLHKAHICVLSIVCGKMGRNGKRLLLWFIHTSTINQIMQHYQNQNNKQYIGDFGFTFSLYERKNKCIGR